jgi:hypothetical protein
MALRKKKQHWHGDDHADVVAFLRECSAAEYPAEHFANAICAACKGDTFAIQLEEGSGVVRTCSRCKVAHPVGDSAEYLGEGELDECQCPCGEETFQLTIGVALYAESADVKWLYVGLRCVACGLIGNYGDWKNEFEDYRRFLVRT